MEQCDSSGPTGNVSTKYFVQGVQKLQGAFVYSQSFSIQMEEVCYSYMEEKLEYRK